MWGLGHFNKFATRCQTASQNYERTNLITELDQNNTVEMQAKNSHSIWLKIIEYKVDDDSFKNWITTLFNCLYLYLFLFLCQL